MVREDRVLEWAVVRPERQGAVRCIQHGPSPVDPAVREVPDSVRAWARGLDLGRGPDLDSVLAWVADRPWRRLRVKRHGHSVPPDHEAAGVRITRRPKKVR